MSGKLRDAVGAIFFSWECALKGYVWDSGQRGTYRLNDPTPEQEIRFLRKKYPNDRATQTYNPFAASPPHPFSRLWHEFVLLEPTEKTFLEFANRYGRLSHDQTDEFSPVEIEPYALWLEHHKAMSWAYLLSEVVKSQDKKVRKDLLNEVTLDDGKRGVTISDIMPSFFRGTDLHNFIRRIPKEYLAAKTSQERRLLMRLALADVVQIALEGNIKPRVLFEGEISVDAKLNVLLSPNDLITAMWLQFAHYVTSVERLEQCTVCRTWFILERAYGTKRTYCSRPCQQKAFRERSKLEKASATTAPQPNP